jgi:hypothetical protein
VFGVLVATDVIPLTADGGARDEPPRQPEPVADVDPLQARLPAQLVAVQKFAVVSNVPRGLRNGFEVEPFPTATDADLTLLKGLPDVHTVKLNSCVNITDAGLAHLGEVKDLPHLDLVNMPGVTDAGLAHLKGLQQLTFLALERCDRVTDAGLAHLKGLPELRFLSLRGTSITDAGLAQLVGVKKLRELDLRDTPTTKEGVKQLQAARPNLVVIKD